MLTLVVAFAMFWGARTQYAVAQRTEQLARQSVALASGVATEDRLLDSPSTRRLRSQLFRVQARLVGAALFVTDSQGKVLRSSGQVSADRLPIETLSATRGTAATSGVRVGNQEDVLVLMVAAPVPGRGEFLVAVQPLRDVLVPWEQLTGAALLALIVATIVSVLLGWLLARRLSQPLRRLRDGALSIAGGDWGAQVPEEGDAEVASLAHSFNEMSSKVAEAYSAQQSFVGDVSHELRTPITSIRGYAEAIMDGTLTRPEDVKRAASVIRAESLRMEEMSYTLLALAALDAETAQPELQSIDLGKFAEALSERFVTIARDARVALELEIGPTPQPLGDPERLLQAASAVISNGLWYTPTGGTVRVRTLAHGPQWGLQIDDTGPGIPPERREAVFNRFVRLDPSRSKGSGGVGLGLAIARRAVELMGGSIVADASDDLGGARFVIGLPFAQPTA